MGLRMRVGGTEFDTSKHAAAATTVRANKYRFMVPKCKRARPGAARSPVALWNPALRGSLRAVEDGHFAEAGSGLEDGEGLFSRAGDGPGDAHFPLGNDEQAVARLAFLEHVVADRELLLAAHFRYAGELAVVQVLEDRR